LNLPRAIEGGGHPSIDCRLNRARIAAGLLDPEFNAQDVAHHWALCRSAEVEHGHLPVCILRQRMSRPEQQDGKY
jgi:hypothetical protein